MVLKAFDLLPGELGQMMEACGVECRGGTPDFLRSALAQVPGTKRPLDQILEGVDLGQAALKIHLETLACPARLVEVRRVARRRLADRSFACLQAGIDQPVTAFMPGFDSTSSLLLFDTADDFMGWLMAGLEEYPVPEIPLQELPPAQAEVWSLVMAFCDLFLEQYRAPDENWWPYEPIRFTAGDVGALFDQRPSPPDSWIEGYRSVIGEDSAAIVPPGDGLEALIWLLCNEELLVPEDENRAAAEPAWSLSRRMTWLIRALAWWDRGFWIGFPGEERHSWLTVQASALWLLRKGVTPEGSAVLKLDAVSGKELRQALTEFARTPDCPRPSISLERVVTDDTKLGHAIEPGVPAPVLDFGATLAPAAILEVPETLPAVPEPVASPLEPPPPQQGSAAIQLDGRLCPGCSHHEPSSTTRFCRQCGQPLPPPTETVPLQLFCGNCGQSLRPGTRYCTSCGSAVELPLGKESQ